MTQEKRATASVNVIITHGHHMLGAIAVCGLDPTENLHEQAVDFILGGLSITTYDPETNQEIEPPDPGLPNSDYQPGDLKLTD